MPKSTKNQNTTTSKGRIILVAGGSGVGKTSAIKLLSKRLESIVVAQDAYIDHSQAPITEYGPNNDHPSVIDWLSFIDDVCTAQDQNSIVIVEGTLVLHNEKLRELSDLSLYLALNDAERITRRKQKTPNSDHVYVDTVLQDAQSSFVEPTSRHADTVLQIDDMTPHEVASLIEGEILRFLETV